MAIAFSSSRGLPPESTASATFGPTPCTPTSIRNSSRSSVAREAEQLDRVVAQHEVGVQRASRPSSGTLRSVSARHRQPVADPPDSITTSPGRRESTVPRTEAITAG